MTIKTTNLKEVTIYTDGGCDPNPGPGGYGVVLIYEKKKKELSGGFSLSTNNRMEIYAAIKGLEALKFPCKVKLFSDSRYLVDAVTKGWVIRWKRNGWMRNKEEKALNIDLWEKLFLLCEKHEVEFIWVKGHAGDQNNERCDELSNLARLKSNLPIDPGYKEQIKNVSKKITQEGDLCNKCSTPVIRKKSTAKLKPGQKYYYEFYFQCPKCKTIYLADRAKKYIK
jgi:ribonuclease HI